MLSMATSPSLIFCTSPMYGLMMAVCLNMFVMASSEFFLPGPGLGHHHARFGYFWLTPYLELNYSTTEIDPSSNWIVNRQEPSGPQEHNTDASRQFQTSKKLLPIAAAVQLRSKVVACFFRTMLRASRKSWGMLLHLPLMAMSPYRITPVNI